LGSNVALASSLTVKPERRLDLAYNHRSPFFSSILGKLSFDSMLPLMFLLCLNRLISYLILAIWIPQAPVVKSLEQGGENM
jgi:hypothetical protein